MCTRCVAGLAGCPRGIRHPSGGRPSPTRRLARGQPAEGTPQIGPNAPEQPQHEQHQAEQDSDGVRKGDVRPQENVVEDAGLAVHVVPGLRDVRVLLVDRARPKTQGDCRSVRCHTPTTAVQRTTSPSRSGATTRFLSWSACRRGRTRSLRCHPCAGSTSAGVTWSTPR